MKIQKEKIRRHNMEKKDVREKEQRERERKKWKEIRASDEKRKTGYKKVSLKLAHVSGGKKNTGEKLCARHSALTRHASTCCLWVCVCVRACPFTR